MASVQGTDSKRSGSFGYQELRYGAGKGILPKIEVQRAMCPFEIVVGGHVILR